MELWSTRNHIVAMLAPEKKLHLTQAWQTARHPRKPTEQSETDGLQGVGRVGFRTVIPNHVDHCPEGKRPQPPF